MTAFSIELCAAEAMAEAIFESSIERSLPTENFPLLRDADGDAVSICSASPIFKGRSRSYTFIHEYKEIPDDSETSTEADWREEHKNPNSIPLHPWYKLCLFKSKSRPETEQEKNSNSKSHGKIRRLMFKTKGLRRVVILIDDAAKFYRKHKLALRMSYDKFMNRLKKVMLPLVKLAHCLYELDQRQLRSMRERPQLHHFSFYDEDVPLIAEVEPMLSIRGNERFGSETGRYERLLLH
ncbi:hypothetical protein SBRCBS47491_001668 [Sporothrix bragantina]|uniref:Uncharacterized protein n=1 Tax=Sporothrix bragantina TaxID=671064 RepID=A0ABP0B0H0_9PEZI